jgi:hypothetical protein
MQQFYNAFLPDDHGPARARRRRDNHRHCGCLQS